MNPTISKIQQYPATYDYAKVDDVLDVSETYEPLLTLDVPHREVGVYNFVMSMTYTFSSTSTSMFFRWRMNGGEWYEYSAEPKDKTDSRTAYYAFPIEHKGGPRLVETEMRKETSNGVLNVNYFDMVFERKG